MVLCLRGLTRLITFYFFDVVFFAGAPIRRPSNDAAMMLEEFVTFASKGATLSRLSDLGVSKEGGNFLGMFFESLREAGGSVCEVRVGWRGTAEFR